MFVTRPGTGYIRSLFSLFFKQVNFKMTIFPDTYSVVLQVNILILKLKFSDEGGV